jgi:hypothetical protein
LFFHTSWCFRNRFALRRFTLRPGRQVFSQPACRAFDSRPLVRTNSRSFDSLLLRLDDLIARNAIGLGSTPHPDHQEEQQHEYKSHQQEDREG